jgi:hypothetical protein
MVGASGFEPPTSWSRTRNIISINAFSGVAYGTKDVIPPLLVVPNLYLAERFRVESPELSRPGESKFRRSFLEACHFRTNAFVLPLPGTPFSR